MEKKHRMEIMSLSLMLSLEELPQIVPAFVVNGKAYTGRIVQSKLSWLRKMDAIIVIDPSLIPEKEKEEINRNIEADNVKDIGVWTERLCV